MGTEFLWDLFPLKSRKEWSHEEAPTRRSRKSRAVSRRTSPIMPRAFWSELEGSSVSPPVECVQRAEAQSQHLPTSSLCALRDPRMSDGFSGDQESLISFPEPWETGRWPPSL